jgi:lipid II:glycine glycyltransferase (peptidoglycan interpeptide bridge formation enzyme)
MPVDISIINPINVDIWDDMLRSSKDYSFFHSVAWAKVLKNSYGYKPFYFYHGNNNELSALIPFMQIDSILNGRRGVSLPFSDFCEPIVNGTADPDEIFSSVTDFGRKYRWKYLEIRGGQKLFSNMPSSASYYHHYKNLSRDEEKLFSSFSKVTKRNIRKAIRMGLEIKLSHSFDSLKAFYKLNCYTRKKHGLPPQPFAFFNEIFDQIVSTKNGMVVLATKNNQILAGAIFFHFGRKAVFKYGASNQQFLHLRPNNLIMCEAIKWYAKNGYQFLSFGRTSPGNHGLRRYKAGWGTEEQMVNYYRYNLIREEFEAHNGISFDWLNKIFKRLPIPILRAIGSVLYSHMG